MGFMDKAKKLAEQAQQKLDEAQKNFNRVELAGRRQPAERRRPVRRARRGPISGGVRPPGATRATGS